MKNKILLALVVFLTIVLIVQTKSNLSNNDIRIEENKTTIDVKDSNTGDIENKGLEDYVVGVVAAEMPASFNEEALKAQAIASRTYAYYKITHSNKDYDVLSDISDQAYINESGMKEKWGSNYENYYKKIVSAVNSTKNEIMTYDGEVIKSFYFAMSNGYTSNVQTVFGENYPYLVSVESKWDNDSLNKYEVINTLSTNDFCNKLNISCNPLIINNQKYDETGRTEEITINSTTFKGTEIRKLLDLRSTDIKIEVEGDNVTIITKGYGHGVGLSQYGANGMASDGYDCYEILKHYYQGIKIEKI